MGLARSKDLTNKKKEKKKSPPLANRLRNSQKRKFSGRRQKNHGPETKYRFDISKKIMGLVQSTDLNLY